MSKTMAARCGGDLHAAAIHCSFPPEFRKPTCRC